MLLFKKDIEHELLSAKLKDNRPMTELQFFAAEIKAWELSPARLEMIDGCRYYNGDHDILQRKRKAIGKDGDMVEVKNLPNNKIVDNQYAKHVDQKKNYLLGKPITFSGDNDAYLTELKAIFGPKFMRTLKNAGLDALNTGIAWLYPYYNEEGKLDFRYFSGTEILPFWRDAAHTKLDCAIRLYVVELYEGSQKKYIKKVNIFKADGMYSYIYENGLLKPDEDATAERVSYITAVDAKGKETEFNWARIPLIPIKYNAQEIPLIRRARSLQDAINELQSDFKNNMDEDVHNTVLVLKNYDGQDLGEFRQNLATYGAVKVRSVEGVQGGVDTLEVTVNADNYKAILELLKSALIENMRSFDGKDDRLKGSPNQMNIQSLYMDIDLDANETETELQAAFEELLWFINQHLTNTGSGNYDGIPVTVIFNRDTLVNETEAIENCSKSTGIISDETIIAQHPWVTDPQKEIERMTAQKEEQMQSDPYRAAFESSRQGGDPNAEE